MVSDKSLKEIANCYYFEDTLVALQQLAIRYRKDFMIPVVGITGSNGKTTSVRLLTAIAMAHGWHTANSCTDGIYLDGALIEGGDYSGPGGARSLLRNRQAQAAILETARGGLLRRGLGIERADVALVTNVSPDHFGEYGIHDLDGLAQVKLTVARAIGPDGTLVLNADNAPLRCHADGLDAPQAWFSVDDDHPLLRQARADGRRSCGVRDGRLRLRTFNDTTHLDPIRARQAHEPII